MCTLKITDGKHSPIVRRAVTVLGAASTAVRAHKHVIEGIAQIVLHYAGNVNRLLAHRMPVLRFLKSICARHEWVVLSVYYHPCIREQASTNEHNMHHEQ